LGIIDSDDLKWEKQCTAAVKQANKILAMMKRHFVDRSKETMLALYKSLVRPHLEYPYLVKDIKLVESVQRRATKMVQGIQHLNYDDRLNYLKLTRFEKGRVRSDLTGTFKFIKGMYDVENLRKSYFLTG